MSLANQIWKQMVVGATLLALMSVLGPENSAVADRLRLGTGPANSRLKVNRKDLGSHQMANRAPVNSNRVRRRTGNQAERQTTRIPPANRIGRRPGGPVYYVTVYEAQYRRPNETRWQRLGTYSTRREADRQLFLAYDRGHIPRGSQMRIVERRRRATPPPAMETKYFVVYRPPGAGQRELGPYDTRRDAELALFRGVERGQIPSGSRTTIQQREVPVE